MSRPVVYTTDVKDAVTRLPVAVVDTTALPLDGSLPDLQAEVPELIAQLPDGEFVIVYFASRAPKAPQMNWTRRLHAGLPHDLKKRLKKVYVVHARWYSKALNRALAPIVSPKFALKIHYMGCLADLAREMDISAIDISPGVYLDDTERNEAGDVGAIPVPKHSRSIFGLPLESTPTSYWRAAFTFLSQSTITAGDLVPMCKADDEAAALVAVLIHAVAREQKLRLYDYGPFVVLSVIKEYLLSLPDPLIRISDCTLPIRDNEEYSQHIIQKLPPTHIVHLRDLVAFARQSGLPSSAVASSLGPAVMGLVNSGKKEAAISTRVLRILFDYWDDSLQTPDKERFMKTEVPPPLPSRRVSSSSSSSSIPPVPPAPLRQSHDSKQPTAMVNPVLPVAKGPMPRELPSEITEMRQQASAPNRKAYGKVAEIMRLYNDDR